MMDRNEAESVIRDTIEFANKEIKKNKKKPMLLQPKALAFPFLNFLFCFLFFIVLDC